MPFAGRLLPPILFLYASAFPITDAYQPGRVTEFGQELTFRYLRIVLRFDSNQHNYLASFQAIVCYGASNAPKVEVLNRGGAVYMKFARMENGGRYNTVRWRKRPDYREAWPLAAALSLSALLGLMPAGILRAQVPTNELHGDCLFCHLGDSQTAGSLILPEPEVCQLCHSPHNDHAILIQTGDVDPSLPLTNGLMTCITCHDQHSPQPLQLRLPTIQLCTSCHDR